MILPDVPSDFDLKPGHSTNTPNNDSHDENIKKDFTPKAKKPSKDLISALDLYDVFKQKKTDLDSILLIDIRDPMDYVSWKIQHEPSINISPTLLRPDANLNSVERHLSKATWEVWVTRFQKSILLIVSDEFDDSQEPELLLVHPAVVLQEILCKCEAEYCVYILIGGIQKWVIHYPAMTVNPDFKRTVSWLTSHLVVSIIIIIAFYAQNWLKI